MRQLTAFQGSLDQGVSHIHRRGVGGQAEAGHRHRIDASLMDGVQHGSLELAVPGEQAQQIIAGGQSRPCRFGGAEVVLDYVLQGGQRIAHGHRPADQILLFQPVVRKAQQVVLVGQVFHALVEVDLNAPGSARTRQPETRKIRRRA